MAGQPLTDLVDEVSEEITIMKSASVLIRGFNQRLTDAVAAALANGATEAELAPLTDLKAELDTTGNDLASAVSENTPSA
jgi:hypothetical protein